jgi:hypothetical protein
MMELDEIIQLVKDKRDSRPNPGLNPKTTDFTNGAWFALDDLFLDLIDIKINEMTIMGEKIYEEIDLLPNITPIIPGETEELVMGYGKPKDGLPLKEERLFKGPFTRYRAWRARPWDQCYMGHPMWCKVGSTVCRKHGSY